ncbi:MAG: carboxylesterase family protein [Acidobacteriaceae bacterium]
MLIRTISRVAGITVLALSLPAWAGNPLVVKTDQGKIQGKMSADGKARNFLGIPFAAPPVGPLRWKPPQTPAKWKGVRPASTFGSRCMQQERFDDMVFRDPGESEDCLTLNVWTPAKSKGKLPVMVWIFGGGFVGGGTSEPRQDGEHLTRKGVLVVSMNYRLGIFGFFATPELIAEDPHHAAGNYGLMDELAAIQWVHRNIAAFGGDPNNVTIFGESAGSFAVSAQMASPLAQGLFAHAIGESGAAFAGTTLNFPTANSFARQTENYLRGARSDVSLAALRAAGSEEILQLGRRKAPGKPRFGPDVDGYFLAESVPAIYAAGKQAHIPLIAGWNQDEAGSNVVTKPEKGTLAGLQGTAERDFGPRAADFLKAYHAGSDADAVRVAKDYAGDDFLVYSTWAWLEAQVKTGASPVYRYLFALPSPGDPFHPVSAGAFHSDEIEYVFGNLDYRKGAPFRPEDYKLSDLMQTFWTNFARTGDPNGAALPQWPKYAPTDWPVMRLSPDPGAAPDQHRDRYLFLQQVWGDRRPHRD